jgi:hypothetical protein
MCIESNTIVFFSPLVAIFGHYDHHQANAIQSVIFSFNWVFDWIHTGWHKKTGTFEMPSGSHVQLAALRNRDLELQTTSPFSNHGSVERSTACFRRKNGLVLLGFQKFPLFCVILYIFCHCILVRNLSAIWREVQQYAQAVFRPARTSVPTQQADGPSEVHL